MVTMNDPPLQEMDADRAFLFLVHRKYGLLLLYTTRKKSKGPHYQVPGGHAEQEDFDRAAGKNSKNSGAHDRILPYKICAARELYEETGIDLRGSLDRLQPVQLKSSKANKISCEYKKRLFFTAQIFDQDISLQDNQYMSSSSLTQALDKNPPNAMLKLSEEHQGFSFERNLSKAIEVLTLHSGGKVSTALSMAVDSGEVTRLIGEAADAKPDDNGEQMHSPIECNKVIKRELDMAPCKEANPSDCHRTYILYFPQIVCDNHNYLREVGPLPLVFAVHCYGCNSQVVMESFIPYANSHSAIIVAPDGLHASFNALDCCGYALTAKIDDVGFFSQIQKSLDEEYSFVRPSYSYAVGWSNGGFMVMYSAKLFRAISPISGYIIDYSDIKAGTSIFFHHSLNDPFVQATGCCSNTDMPACCCGIFADQCVSVQQVMKDVAQRKNGCDYEVGEVHLEQSYEDTSKGISCLTATSESCISNNTICLYENSGHFNGGSSFANSFPMSGQIMDFFAKDICNGLWSDNKCVCEEGFGGAFCIDLLDGEVVSSETELSSHQSRHTFTGGILLLTIACLCLLKHIASKGKRKDKNDKTYAEEKIELVTRL